MPCHSCGHILLWEGRICYPSCWECCSLTVLSGRICACLGHTQSPRTACILCSLNVKRPSYPQLVQMERASPASEPHRAHFVTAERPYFFLCPVQLASLPPQVVVLRMVPRIQPAHKFVSLLPRGLALKHQQFFKKHNLFNNSFSGDEARDHL